MTASPPPEEGAGDTLPLAGVRVLDLTQVIAGPFCTLMLADMGADVLKLERSGHGDDLRSVGRYPGREAHEDYFNAVNRSKRSLALDLKIPEDQECARALAAKADVLVENFAPGTAERLGLGWDVIHRRNPRLIYCSISGFGQTGPACDRLALDPIIQAVSGVMSVTGDPAGPPMQIGAPLADVLAGMQAAYAIVALLHATRRGGLGRRIDISMQDTMLAALGPRMGEALQAGLQPQRCGNQNPMRVPADTYPTADGRYLSVICQNQRHWQPLCQALEQEAWFADERFAAPKARLRNRTVLNEQIKHAIAARPASHWVARFDLHRIPYALVNSYLDAVEDPQVTHRGLVRGVHHPVSGDIRVVGPPWIVDGMTFPIRPPPLLDQHHDELLREWLSEEDVAVRSGAAHVA